MPLKLESKSKEPTHAFAREFFRGLTTPLHALKMIFEHPKLISLSLFPIFMTLLVAGLCIYGVLTGAWYIGNHWFETALGNYANAATGLFAFVVGIFSLYLLFHSIGILLSFVASPFNDWLAEETERASGATPMPLSFSVFFRVFLLDLRKTILTLSVSIGLWFLAFIPGAGILSAIGFALITTLTFISYPQSRRQLGVLECLAWMKAHFFASLGFGLATMILFGLPVLNAFSLPLSVVGGTLLFLGETKSEPENLR